MPEITASVGSRGKNRVEDVKIVQRLLNNHLSDIGAARPLLVDGLAGRKTVIAIVEFQSRVAGMLEPDGRVDPGGRTLAFLNRKTLTLSQLPASGDGYYTYADRSGQFGTGKTIQSVEMVGIRVNQLGFEVGIGDISLKGGGKMPGHLSHQRGVDVDIRPVRNDGKQSPVTIQNTAAYSRGRTRGLVDILLADPNLELILFNDDAIPGVRPFRGHDNHLHVRFKD